TPDTSDQRARLTPAVGGSPSRGSGVGWGTTTVNTRGESAAVARSMAGGGLTGRSDFGSSVLGEASPPDPTAAINAKPSVRPIPSNVTLCPMSTARGAQPAELSMPRVQAPRAPSSLPISSSAAAGAEALGPAEGVGSAAVAVLLAAIALCALRFAPATA